MHSEIPKQLYSDIYHSDVKSSRVPSYNFYDSYNAGLPQQQDYMDLFTTCFYLFLLATPTRQLHVQS